MSQHTSLITEAIKNDQHDLAWRRIHDFQDWCLERIEIENHGKDYAGTLLSVPHKFFIRILDKEGKHKQALIHRIFEAASDWREFKYYPKEIKKCFKKCGFESTSVEEAISLLDESKGAADFVAIRDVVASWH